MPRRAKGVSLLKVSTGTIESALEALPYVRSVHVYREFPHALEIRLEEYEPVARVRSGDGKTWLVTEDGRVLERSGSREGPELPLVVPATQFAGQPGSGAPPAVVAALPVVAMLEASVTAGNLPAAERISVASGGEVVVHLEGGTELRLGEPTDLKQKMMVAAAIFQEYLRDGKRLEYVDASAADRAGCQAQMKVVSCPL